MAKHHQSRNDEAKTGSGSDLRDGGAKTTKRLDEEAVPLPIEENDFNSQPQ